jgi:hypothetical protein
VDRGQRLSYHYGAILQDGIDIVSIPTVAEDAEVVYSAVGQFIRDRPLRCATGGQEQEAAYIEKFLKRAHTASYGRADGISAES